MPNKNDNARFILTPLQNMKALQPEGDTIPEEQLQEVMKLMTAEGLDEALQKTFQFAKLMSYYRCAMMEIETKLNVLNEEFSLRFDRQPINSIKSRLKNPLSIRKKMYLRGYPFTVESIEENLNDIAGVRVVCSFLDDVYMISEALKQQDDLEILIEKDYIANPKPNGYRSLHLIVSVPIFLQKEKRSMRAEVQLRTVAMDAWASLEHQLRYKKDFQIDEHMSRELKRCADLSAEVDSRMDSLRSTVYGSDAADEMSHKFLQF